MQVPVRVVLGKLPQSSVVRDEALKAATVLERFHDRITACRVAVTNPDSRHRRGGLFDVHVVLQVPGGKDIVISRRAEDQPEHEHLKVALRKAFAQARRRLQDRVRALRGDVKRHVGETYGRVAKLFARGGYGIIATSDEREIYFHRNSVVDGKFPKLAVGARVRFVETLGEKGPQASTVIPVATGRLARATRAT
jgi:cold shock CspA family protein